MSNLRRVSVFGGREITRDIYDETVILGNMLAKEGYTIFCGGGRGVMEAISKGAVKGNGLVIGILKGRNLEEANEFISIPILTDIGIARNAILAYNCDVALAISGNYGTLSEIAYAFQLKRPVVGYKTWGISPIIKAKSPEDVMLKIKKELFVFKEEMQLYNFLTKLSKSNKISSELSYNKIQLDHFNEFNSLIEKFFDNVLVNDKKNQIKNNRIKLLENIKLNFEKICKFQLLKI